MQVIKWDKNFNCVASFIKKINALNRLAETSTQSLELIIREALRVSEAKKINSHSEQKSYNSTSNKEFSPNELVKQMKKRDC